MYIKQELLAKIDKWLLPNKVLIIYGPRRCGKTTLLNKFLAQKKDYLLLAGEDINTQEELSSQSIEKLKNFVGKTKLLVIDEAQEIPNIGLNLKLIVDHIKDIKIIATGSSSLDLASQTGEPLTGRKYTLQIFPLSQLEISRTENPIQTKANLENRLIYGAYPEIIISQDNRQKEKYLNEIINSYLYKDILKLDGIRHSDKIIKLLQLLAFQIGKEAHLTELGSQLSMNKITVERYLDLLEKSFVIFRLNGFSRNLRKEISKSSRYYFYDNGIRNALIRNFNNINMRDDIGVLWENYIIVERLKKQEYTEIIANNYFWRTYDQKEIDLIEERQGKLCGYEIKWGNKKKKLPKLFLNTYKHAILAIINRDNYLDFIT